VRRALKWIIEARDTGVMYVSLDGIRTSIGNAIEHRERYGTPVARYPSICPATTPPPPAPPARRPDPTRPVSEAYLVNSAVIFQARDNDDD